MMEALAPAAPAPSSCPRGCSSARPARSELRRKLVEDYDLLAVVSLPAGVFKPYAGVKTGVLVFRRPTAGAAKNPKTNRLSNVCSTRSRRRLRPRQDPGRWPAGNAGAQRHPGSARSVAPLQEVRLQEASRIKVGAILPEGTAESRSWWTTVDALTEDSARRRPLQAPDRRARPRGNPRSSSARPSPWSARS